MPRSYKASIKINKRTLMARTNPPRYNYLNNLYETEPEQSPRKPTPHSENDYDCPPAQSAHRPIETPIAQLQHQDTFCPPYTEREKPKLERKPVERIRRQMTAVSAETTQPANEKTPKREQSRERDVFRIIKESHLMSDKELLGSDMKKPTLIEELSESHFTKDADRNPSKSKSPLKLVIETQRTKSKTPLKRQSNLESIREFEKQSHRKPYLEPNSHEGYLPDDYRKTICKVKAYEELGMKNVAFLQVNPQTIPKRRSKDNSKRTNNPYKYTCSPQPPPPEHAKHSQMASTSRQQTLFRDHRDYLNPPEQSKASKRLTDSLH